MGEIYENIELKATPTEKGHVVNKDYVDGKMVTKTWTEYQALSEEEKNNGTLYDIPDMPTAGQGGIITTYTALEQLGLSAGASVADIVNAMPNCSYAEIGCHREENPYGLEHITGLPSEDGNFILTVRKYNLYRVDIQAKTSASGAVMNDLYVGGMLANGTTVEWRRVCTTTVKDVAKTSVVDKIDTTFANFSNGNCYYSVTDGECVIIIHYLTPLSAIRGTKIFPSGTFPIPRDSLEYSTLGSSVDSIILFRVYEDGSAAVWGNNMANVGFFGTCKYKVAE